MADIKVIKTVPFLSCPDIVDFARSILELVQNHNVTSIGICACLTDGEKPFIYHQHISTDEDDQDDFEVAALELRHSIIDALDDWQADLYDDD